jgi:superfamily II DNA or RNA helicase
MEKNLKAVLSNRIILPYSLEMHKLAKSECTYKVPSMQPGGKPIELRTFNVINRKYVTLPIGKIDLIPKDYIIVDKRTTVEAYFPETVDTFIEKLRDSQLEAYKLVKDNYLINAKPGWGKTFTAIAIATKLLQKTLVVVHTLALRDQWEREVQATLGFDPGIIGSGKFNIDSPIVIANVQSLVKYMEEIRHEFGLLVIDECHHIPATTFTKIIDKSSARYKIGLSGTLQRKDFKHVLIYDYISKAVYVPPKENVMDPIVLIYKSEIKIPGNYDIPWATRITKLMQMDSYRETILKFARAQADRGHKVLVVSDRVEFLKDLASRQEDALFITAEIKDRDGALGELDTDKNILYGSISIFKEGLSKNNISCLILATAISNEHMIVQLVGRIIRKNEGKLRPEVVDIALDGATGKRQLINRLKAYRQEGYETKYLN